MDTDAVELAALTERFFRAVSFRRGDIPAYGRVRALFVEGGKLINNSSEIPEIWTVEGFIASRRKTVDAGELTSFEEVETSATVEVFGRVAHRLSAYEKRGTRQDGPFAGGGLISTQFILTPRGWRVSSMAWDDNAL
jgi:hypothetical protein